MMKTKSKISLALGAGGAKGLAHIGVLRELEENKIPISYISGTSAGALIGALYAYTLDTNQVQQFFMRTSRREIYKNLLDLSFTGGLLKGNHIEKVLKEFFGNATFDDLKIPLAIVATDMGTCEPVVLREGQIVKAIMASIAAAPLIRPRNYQGKLLTDGGLTDPVPIEILKKMGATAVIAVNLTNGYFKRKPNAKDTAREIGLRSISISQVRLSRLLAEGADVIIEPQIDNAIILGVEHMFSDDVVKRNLKLGVLATKEKIRKIKSLSSSQQSKQPKP